MVCLAGVSKKVLVISLMLGEIEGEDELYELVVFFVLLLLFLLAFLTQYASGMLKYAHKHKDFAKFSFSVVLESSFANLN